MQTESHLPSKKLSKGVAETIATAATSSITPAGVIMEVLKSENIVREYFKEQDVLEDIILDFGVLRESQHTDPKETTQAIEYILDESQDRYITQLSFVLGMQNEEVFRKTFAEIISKYLPIDQVIEDLSGLATPLPNKQWEIKEKTALDQFGKNLTQMAFEEELPTIIGRDEEVVRMLGILTRQTKSNPILLGDAGVGKTALVEKLATILLSKKGIPFSLHDYQIVELNMAQVLSDDNIEITLLAIIEASIKEKAILFIDEVHQIMENDGKIANLLKPAMARGDLKLIGATTNDEYKAFEKDEAIQRRFQPIKVQAPSKTMVYDILKTKARDAEKFHNVIVADKSLLKAIALSEQYLAHRQQPDKSIDLIEEASSRVRMTLESKPEEIISVEAKIADITLEKEMLLIKTDEPSNREKVKIDKIDQIIVEKKKELEELNSLYNEQRKLLDSLIDAKEELAKQQQAYDDALHYSEYDNAAEILLKTVPSIEEFIEKTEEELLDSASNIDTNLIQNVVTPEMISRVIEIQTGIPASAQGEDDLKKYRDIDTVLKKEVHGQVKAIDLITNAIKRSKAGLSDKDKPLGSFLCLGPTGVGKTYLAQKLAEFMFDTDKVMKRFDMSEYMEPHSVSRLFGSPPGYVGHDEGGQLTETVRRNPYSIILFDEIEKAHKRIFDALLQILDAGRMTDGKGNIVDFKNTIIIMTSNIGSDTIRSGLEKGYANDTIEEALMEEIKKHFRPEFLNRFDAKVMFNSLDKTSVEKIALRELEKLSEKLLEDNELDLYWSKSAPYMITESAYNLIDGARPIKRFINDQIITILTNRMLNGEIEKDSKIYLIVDGENFDIIPVDDIALEQLQELDAPNPAPKKKKASKAKKAKKAKEAKIVKTELVDDINQPFPKTELGD